MRKHTQGPDGRFVPQQRPLIDRTRIEGECWVWTDARFANGYGAVRDGKRIRQAHRWAYEQLVGPIPEGHDLDHLCRNRACVRPTHLEPVSRSVNITRARRAI